MKRLPSEDREHILRSRALPRNFEPSFALHTCHPRSTMTPSITSAFETHLYTASPAMRTNAMNDMQRSIRYEEPTHQWGSCNPEQGNSITCGQVLQTPTSIATLRDTLPYRKHETTMNYNVPIMQTNNSSRFPSQIAAPVSQHAHLHQAASGSRLDPTALSAVSCTLGYNGSQYDLDDSSVSGVSSAIWGTAYGMEGSGK